VVALLYVALTSPLQVGSNLLLGVGRAGAIVRAAAAAVLVNVAASLVLVHAEGIVGVFLGTLVGTALLVPMLGRAMLAEVGTSAEHFLRVAMAPVVIATLALVVAAGTVVVLPLPDWVTVLGATVAGAGAYAVAASRLAFQPGELGRLKEIILGRH
jgi:O-antigen/teichoic acid export membrane protein